MQRASTNLTITSFSKSFNHLMTNYIFDSIPLKYERWIECETNRMDDGEFYVIAIYRDKATLSKLYLSFQKEANFPLLCFVPITPDVQIDVNTTQMMITFNNYQSISTIFLMTNTQKFEQILAQFCQGMQQETKLTDNFYSYNLQFLNSIRSDKSFVEASRENGLLSPLQRNSAYATPITSSNNHLKLWKDRIYSLNSGFVTEKKQIHVTFLTWNVASVRPNSTTIDELSRSFTNGASKSDIIFIALQEIDMSVVSVVAGSSKKVKGAWTNIIKIAVNQQNGEFFVAAHSCLGGVYAALIFRKNVFPNPVCGDVKTIRLGVHGFAANKGAIIFPVFVGATKFIFMGCHLTAGSNDENWESRNNQLRQLMRLVDGNYDYLSIIGDLNYRINLSYEKCIEYIQQNNVSELLSKDQLRITRSRDPLLSLLKEPNQKFMPTYKFDPDSDTYDTSPKHRVPSYTDRILLRRGRKRISVDNLHEPVFDLNYKSQLNFPSMPVCVDFSRGTCKFSDHRSVLCAYKFEVPNVVVDKLETLNEEIEMKVFEIAESLRPSVTLEPSIFVFNGNVQQNFSLEMTNRKKAWAFWHADKVQGVEISPSQGMLLPGCVEHIHVKIEGTTDSNVRLRVNFTVDNGDFTTLILTNDIMFAEEQRKVQEAAKIQAQERKPVHKPKSTNPCNSQSNQAPSAPKPPFVQQQPQVQQIQQQQQPAQQQHSIQPPIQQHMQQSQPQQKQFSKMLTPEQQHQLFSGKQFNSQQSPFGMFNQTPSVQPQPQFSTTQAVFGQSQTQPNNNNSNNNNNNNDLLFF
ncbi:hypothetical protein TRFO_25559 [Tritrichomonas foetus]|uniref:Inositol polyphosphate-related phosphatase domain-containing protein n=1 Tax=Tritrichomonas foetus TaxID=1144522 RepID=A0A1J4KAG4_9EUKA|nr:hypothetical protein TRFO_25559 [Tritrichomonas foetus]|eukprot:OHT06445.1 hypothetical protein TRFO_25559 [Tritrichomonas foetus]